MEEELLRSLVPVQQASLLSDHTQKKKFVLQFLKSKKYWWSQSLCLVLLKGEGQHVQYLMVSEIFKLKLLGRNRN